MAVDTENLILISERRRTWLQVGRLSVLGILTLSGMLTMNGQGLLTVYGIVASIAVLSAIPAAIVFRRNPSSRKPYWFLLFTDAILLGAFVYASGGVDGPFMGFLIIHAIAYGLYLGVRGGLYAAGASILVTSVFSIFALNAPGPDTTFSPLISTLLQSGQLKLSASYIAMRIVMNGFLLVATGIGAGVLGQSLYTENGLLQRALDNMAELRARSRQILDSLHDGVVVVDHAGVTINVNPAATQLLGTDKPMENSPLGRIVKDYQANKDFPPEMDIVMGEKIIECKFSQYGEQGGAIVILTDTTDVRNYRAALEERDKLSLIGRLSATMAHEIRNPLASMSGAAQMLATGQLDREKAERMAGLVDKQARRVSELIEGYLSLSRSSRDFPFIRINVNLLIRENVESAMHGFAGGVSVQFTESPDEPFIMANRVRICQVISNLMRNSVEALGNTHDPIIRVSVRVNPDDRSVHIRLSDNGPGIPENFIKRIWEPFQTTRNEGTGLGLYIVKRVIHEHNGTVIAENGTNGGAVFTINLPGTGEA